MQVRHLSDFVTGKMWPYEGQGLSSHISQPSCGAGRKEVRSIP